VAQSDTQYNAARGLGQFKEGGAYGGLRVLMSLHAEPFTVVTRKEANIATFADLSQSLPLLRPWSERETAMPSGGIHVVRLPAHRPIEQLRRTFLAGL